MVKTDDLHLSQEDKTELDIKNGYNDFAAIILNIAYIPFDKIEFNLDISSGRQLLKKYDLLKEYEENDDFI